MLIERCQLLIMIILSTFLIAAMTTANPSEQLELLVVPKSSSSSAAAAKSTPLECPKTCSIDDCLQYASMIRNCTRLIRDQCDCCTVCLRTENQICGGHLNIYGICEQDLLCYQTEQTGICVKACLKFQCLPALINNQTTCECANRRVPCHEKNQDNRNNTNDCEDELIMQQRRQLTSLKSTDAENLIDCSKIVCPRKPINKTIICPSDSYFNENITSLSTNRCCETRGQCVCSSCPKTICGENTIIQIYRTGNPNLPGQCCDQFNCITNSKQCHHEKKIYNENETWSIDQCTTCTCRAGLVDCAMIQCPVYTHCGYMYKPENECCPKCGGCLNDRLHIQHMNSTWLESNGCMKCWCEDGRSRCLAEGCIAPPCENPRQIANVCCPVCDDPQDHEGYSTEEIHSMVTSQSQFTTDRCPPIDHCLLVCEHGLAKDEQGCQLCACSTMSCPSPLCTLKFDRLSKQYCSCMSPIGLNCGQLNCDKHCPFNYSLDAQTGCPMCECNPCPVLSCTKNCTYGLKRNEVGCPICVCKSNFTILNNKTNELISKSWPRQCYSGLFSYSNGEIWFDGCRQCLCHKGEQLCALISCPTPKCAQPILLPNRCCPSCPNIPLLPEPIPSSQVCYASQYVTGEELDFDNCTKCTCLHNIAFCSISLCPPLRCSSPIYEPSLCCPICPPEKSETLPDTSLSHIDEDACLLEDGSIKNGGELWKQDDCRSCLCPRGGKGNVKCFSQTCEQNLPCSNPVLKKGQCCPFCLPPTAAVTICIFNYIQYRSGEHWNVSDCHHCECLYGTIVCHQQKCPSLSCVHTVTLSGHCCPICRDQLSFFTDQDKIPISRSPFGLTIISIFSILILILILIIIILLLILLRGRHRSLSPVDQLPTIHPRSPMTSHHHPTRINSKPSNLFSHVKYDLITLTPDNNPSKQGLSSSSNIPLTSLEQTSTPSIIETNTTMTGISSSNHELEHTTWTEDDPMLQCSVTTSNDDDDDDDDDDQEEEHENISSDNEESRQGQISHPQIDMAPANPTIIYV